MSILIFDNLDLAESALDQINSNMGCPYELPSGYFMDEWAEISQKYQSDLWGYARAQDPYMDNVSGWIDELPNFPDDWYQQDD